MKQTPSGALVASKIKSAGNYWPELTNKMSPIDTWSDLNYKNYASLITVTFELFVSLSDLYLK